MTSPVSLPAGTKLLASHFDAYENLTAAWTSYTPTFASGGTAPVLGNGTLTGKYIQVGKFVAASVYFIAGTTTTFGTAELRFGLPVTIGLGFDVTGTAVLLDSGTTRYSATCLAGSGLSYTTIVVGSSNQISGVIPFTWTTNDAINFQLIYPAA